MKRPSMSIEGRPVSADELRAAVGGASAEWLRARRSAKPKAEKRKHRALTPDEWEAKTQATEQAKKQRKAEREARELERLLARIGHLRRRSEREAAAMLRVRVGWKAGVEPKISSVCPRSLYSRLHPEISARTAGAMTRSRVAADGFKNIVLRRASRGYGRKDSGTREYHPGEAADLVRYILREDGLERGIVATFSNIIEIEGENALYETETFSVDDRRCAQVVGFWNALEAFEAEADADGNVFGHLILAMPSELTPEGRVRAIEHFCLRLKELHLPYVAALHRPDPQGDIRNFHAHIMMSSRPFAIEGPFAWSFEAAKATEFNLGAGIGWLREQAAEAFNEALAHESKDVRYSGLSQARRGVPSTGETHDGPVVTARKREAEADRDERDRLVRGLAAQVVRAAERQAELGAGIDEAAARAQPIPSNPQPVPQPGPQPASQPELPPALAALRERFPDPLRLQGLTVVPLMDFTPADKAADRWYGPALSLRTEIQRAREGLVRDKNGTPELIEEKLKPEHRALLQASALPDIVQETLTQVHRQIMDEERRKRRVAREKETVRQARLAELEKQPIILFDSRLNLLPEFRALFPPEVIALDGVREAMLACHSAALEAENRLIEKKREANRKPSRFGIAGADEPAVPIATALSTPAASIPRQAPVAPPALAAAAPGQASPIATPSTQQTKEDEDWERVLQGVSSGKISTPGKGGTSR